MNINWQHQLITLMNNMNGREASKHHRFILMIVLALIAIQVCLHYFLTSYSQLSMKKSMGRINQDMQIRINASSLINFTQEYDLNQLRQSIKQVKQNLDEDALLHKNIDFIKDTFKYSRQNRQSLRILKESVSQLSKLIDTQQQANYQKLDQVDYKFNLPPKIWLYDDLKQGYFESLNQLYLSNIITTAKQNNYQINIVNHYNYIHYVDHAKISGVAHVLQMLKTRINSNPVIAATEITEDTYLSIEKTLIMLLILSQHGGISISKYFAFVQPLDWLHSISNNIFANKGKSGIPPKVFGFHNISRSSVRTHESQRRKDNRFKLLTRYPGLVSYFLAAVKGSQFVNDLLTETVSILQNPARYISQTEKYRERFKGQFLYMVSVNKIYEEYFEVAAMTILLKKQFSIDKESDKIGLDHYGLVTLNANYGPEKISFFFAGHQGKKILKHLAQIDLKQFQLQIGKSRYISRLPCYYQINDFVDNLTHFKTTITKNSYFQTFFFPNSSEKYIIDQLQLPTIDQNGKSWDSLPRNIWTYWNAGIENSNIIYQLCADNIKRYGMQSNFKVNIVSDSNLHDFLSAQAIKKIQYAVKNQASVIKSQYIKYDLIRLALLVEHGGIYLDLSYVFLENLDWLIHIAKYPSNLIFNRYGDLPDNFLFFNPHYGSPFNFTVNKDINSKVAWHLGYENNFIASIKNSTFVRDWFEMLLKATITPYQSIQKQFMRCDIYNQRWTGFNSLYLLPMNILKYVISLKQLQLQKQKKSKFKDATDYYKIWSMNGYLGQQKFTTHTSYDTDTQDNLFIRMFPQQDAELILGKTLSVIKLYNYPVKFLNSNFMANYPNLKNQFHEKSIFMKYIFNQSRHKVLLEGKRNEIARLLIKTDV